MTGPLAVFTDLDDLDPTPGVTKLTEAGFDVRIADSASPDAIARAASDAVALLVGYARIDADLLDRLPNLRILATCSAGYDMVDAEAARARGLWVCNLPDAATEEVAVHALAAALALVRGFPQADAAVRRGGWTTDLPRLPRRADELTLGLVGMGRIATRLAELAAPIFGRVAAYDPLSPEHGPATVQRTDMDTLLACSDVLSLHAPLNNATRNLIGRAELDRMPAGSFLVNVARGGLIDHAALLDSLDTGKLAGAALDVLPTEPPDQDDPLRTHPGLLLSPHIAFLSDASRRAYVERPAENVIAWHRTGRPLTPVVTPATEGGTL
ncbi:C-terminal binding protein [Streptomyces sp. NBC_01795]|uniref:C-terminal binding protein n=1 Tax=unclassified Streptomyces TaxID=2593676 RepID=UPI002DD8DD35|nr:MULTISPECIES: C-terminal binding protein [unclassified Streptomyces]WSA96621.1 C-terminal binding protein [Streptomyces sp. NBC_01795]WSB81034.1 C-terminal binding protein [Streptomyces sp. NBC_01775]WSS10755.1 C-terminal binding protein [Streptomyces sp. NBC_01186]